jgi:hypothetical protein
MLDQGESLDEDVVRVDDIVGAAQLVRPRLAGRGMGAIVGVQQAQCQGSPIESHSGSAIVSQQRR